MISGREKHNIKSRQFFYLDPMMERNMLNATCTPLRNNNLCLFEMYLKFTKWTTGHTFHDPWQAENRSVLILVPITPKESPLTNPRYVKKTLMKIGHHIVWSIMIFLATDTPSLPGIFESRKL